MDFLREIASPSEFAKLCRGLEMIEARKFDYHNSFRVFDLVSRIMNTEERIEEGVVALCEELARDNVVYVEIRTSLKDLGRGLEEYLLSVLRGIERGTARLPIKVGLVLSMRRNTSELVANHTVKLALKYRDRGIVGLDISGDSVSGDGKNIFASLVRARTKGLPITLHIGESKRETAQQQMLELTTLQPQRIGHGVHLCEEAQQWIIDNHVLVELCLSSAWKSRMIDHPHEHPAIQLMLQGHPVAICTDDPLIFNTTLSEEYAHIALLTGLTLEKIQMMQEANEAYHFWNYDMSLVD